MSCLKWNMFDINRKDIQTLQNKLFHFTELKTKFQQVAYVIFFKDLKLKLLSQNVIT